MPEVWACCLQSPGRYWWRLKVLRSPHLSMMTVRWTLWRLHTIKRRYLPVKVALPRPQSWSFGIHASNNRASSPLHLLNVFTSIVRSSKEQHHSWILTQQVTTSIVLKEAALSSLNAVNVIACCVKVHEWCCFFERSDYWRLKDAVGCSLCCCLHVCQSSRTVVLAKLPLRRGSSSSLYAELPSPTALCQSSLPPCPFTRFSQRSILASWIWIRPPLGGTSWWALPSTDFPWPTGPAGWKP